MANTIWEYFYTSHSTAKGEFRSIEHFESKNEAVRWARSSSKGGMMVSVHSNVENNPLETWVNGQRFEKYENAVDYAAALHLHSRA